MTKRRFKKLKCGICSKKMKVIRVIPAAPHLPELKTFRCTGCQCFLTLEPDEEAERRAAAKRKMPPPEQRIEMVSAAET